MLTKTSKKALSLLLTLAMLVSLLVGTGVSASAVDDTSTVTFAGVNATVKVNDTTVTSATTDSTGSLTFTAVPTSGSVVLAWVPYNSTATITKSTENANVYTISNVGADTTVEVIAAVEYTGQTDTGFYAIDTASELLTLANKVNSGTSYSGSYFVLTADIFVNPDSDPDATVWPAIGTQTNPFNGTFNGAGHYVCNLYVYDTESTTVTHKALFGSVDTSGIVKNVGVTGTIGAYRYAAGIVGYNAGTIECCVNTASITGNDSGTRGSGGIAGVNAGTIKNCYNVGTVHNLFRPAGGIAGINESDAAVIEDCYNRGRVYSEGGNNWAGAIVATQNGSTITNCFYLDNIADSTPYAVAYPTSETGKTSEIALKATTFPETINSTYFKADTNNINDGYPILFWQNSGIPASPSTTTEGYTVSYTNTGASVTETSTGSGSVTFTVTPTVTANIVAVTVPAGNMSVVDNGSNSYTVSGITSNLTVTVDVTAQTTYTLQAAASGVIDVNTATATIDGKSFDNQNLIVDCSGQATALTIKDLTLKTGSANAINFTTGANSLTISGENLVEGTNTNKAAIHVPSAASLTVNGDGTLYIYKSSLGAGIGSDANEASGEITFNHTGAVFVKGTMTGAVIGGDTGVGNIIINSGCLDVVNKARGAGIGGSNQCVGGNVTINGGTVTLVTDFTAPVIGAGAAMKDTAANNGNLIINGGSIKTMIANNAYSSWGLGSTPDGELTVPGSTTEKYVINDAAILADKTDGSGNPVYLYKLAVSGSTFNVDVDGVDFYEGGLHQYVYADVTTSTEANWASVTDNTLYLYLTGEDHLISVDGTYYKLTWSAGTSSFTTSAALPSYTVDGNTNTLAAAKNAMGTNPGVIVVTGTTAISGSETIALGSNQYIVRDASLTGSMFTVGSGASLTVNSGVIFGKTGNTAVSVDGGTFTVAPTAGASFAIGEKVYLASGSKITVGAALTGDLTVECANPSTNPATVIAETTGEYEYFTTTDASHVTYLNGAYGVSISYEGYELILTPANN